MLKFGRTTILLCLLASHAGAEEPARPGPLGVDDVSRLAIAKNLDIQVFRKDEDVQI